MSKVADHDDGSPTGGYEKRDVNVKQIALYSILTIIATVLVVVFVVDYFGATKEELIQEMVLAPQSAELRQLRSREAEELGSYKVLDSEAGRYRIPIDRAMQLLADEAYQRQAEASRW